MRKHELIEDNLDLFDIMEANNIKVFRAKDKLLAYNAFYDITINRHKSVMEAYEIISSTTFDNEVSPSTIRQWIRDMNSKIK